MRLLLKTLLGLAIGILIVGTVAWFAFPRQLAGLAVQAERAASGLSRKQIHIPGFKIVYLEGGQGEPLVLLHGFGANKDNFTRTARTLTPRYRVIAPDLPGFGESDHPLEAHYRIQDQVERLAALFEVLQIKSMHLGGSSMGGYLAAAYASAHPDQVQSLWLLAPGGITTAKQPSEMMQHIASGQRVPLLARNAAEFDEVLDWVFAERPFIPRPIKAVLVERAIEAYPLNLKIFDEIRNQSPPMEALVTQLPTPTLVVWGEQDRVLHVSGAEVLRRLLPKSEIMIMTGVGHLPMLEKPERAAADYLQFRGRLQQAPL